MRHLSPGSPRPLPGRLPACYPLGREKATSLSCSPKYLPLQENNRCLPRRKKKSPGNLITLSNHLFLFFWASFHPDLHGLIMAPLHLGYSLLFFLNVMCCWASFGFLVCTAGSSQHPPQRGVSSEGDHDSKVHGT